VPEPDSILSRQWRALLREPVDLGAGARARVMQQVRATARLGVLATHPRGAVRPTLLGALLAASFVASIVTADFDRAGDGTGRRTLADTIAVHFGVATPPAPLLIDRERIVAVADATRDPAPSPGALRVREARPK
jgi:hypothetical protein